MRTVKAWNECLLVRWGCLSYMRSGLTSRKQGVFSAPQNGVLSFSWASCANITPGFQLRDLHLRTNKKPQPFPFQWRDRTELQNVLNRKSCCWSTHTHTEKEEGGIAKLGNGSSCERRFPQEKIGKCGARWCYCNRAALSSFSVCVSLSVLPVSHFVRAHHKEW